MGGWQATPEGSMQREMLRMAGRSRMRHTNTYVLHGPGGSTGRFVRATSELFGHYGPFVKASGFDYDAASLAAATIGDRAA